MNNNNNNNNYYLKMILEQLDKNLVYTALCNVKKLITDCKDKKLQFKLKPLEEELIQLINKNGCKTYKKDDKELQVIKEDVIELIRRTQNVGN